MCSEYTLTMNWHVSHTTWYRQLYLLKFHSYISLSLSSITSRSSCMTATATLFGLPHAHYSPSANNNRQSNEMMMKKKRKIWMCMKISSLNYLVKIFLKASPSLSRLQFLQNKEREKRNVEKWKDYFMYVENVIHFKSLMRDYFVNVLLDINHIDFERQVSSHSFGCCLLFIYVDSVKSIITLF